MIRKVKTYLEDKMLPVTVQNLGEGLMEGLSNRFGGRNKRLNCSIDFLRP